MTNMLPINASALQRDLDSSIGPRQALLDSANQIPGIKYDPPDELLSWLIWEYGLEQLLPYLEDPRLAIQEGVQWQRIRGTPKSLAMALGWLALDEVEIEPETPGPRFHEYQLDSGQIIAGELLEKLRIVSRYSAPLRSRLSRIYHGYDVRRLKLDQSDYGALLSDYSGVDKDGVVLSFGRQQQSYVALDDITAQRSQNSYKVAYTRDIHWPNLDDQPIGGVSTQSYRSNVRSQAAKIQKTNWLGFWDDRSWYGTEFPNITLKAIRIYIRDHQTQAVVTTPQIQLTANVSLTHELDYHHEQAQLVRTDEQYLTLNADEQIAAQQANSYRHDQRYNHTQPHGSIWLNSWDNRQWHDQAGFTIGIANHPLDTVHYRASTTWQIDGESSHIQTRVTDNQVNESISHERFRHWPTKPSASTNDSDINSHRTNLRNLTLACFDQPWLANWDGRQWQSATTFIIGSANNVLTTSYYQISTVWQVAGQSALIQERSSQSTTSEVINNQLVKQQQTFDPEPLNAKQANSYLTKHHGQKSFGLTQQWLGLWDERQWQHNYDAIVRNKYMALTQRTHKQSTALNEPVSGSGYLAKNSQQTNLGQVNSPSMRVRISPNHNVNPILAHVPIDRVRMSINSLHLDETSSLWFGYWDTRVWEQPVDLNIGHISHWQESSTS